MYVVSMRGRKYHVSVWAAPSPGAHSGWSRDQLHDVGNQHEAISVDYVNGIVYRGVCVCVCVCDPVNSARQ